MNGPLHNQLARIVNPASVLGREKTKLPLHFVPSEHDVLCGKGKECFNYPGNIRFRTILEANLSKYAKSKSKIEKSSIINGIVDEIRMNAPNGGGFIRQDKTGVWFEIGDVLARDKVGHAIRETLALRDPKKNQTKRRNRAAFNKKKQQSQQEEAASSLASKLILFPQDEMLQQEQENNVMTLPNNGIMPPSSLACQDRNGNDHSSAMAFIPVPPPPSSSIQTIEVSPPRKNDENTENDLPSNVTLAELLLERVPSSSSVFVPLKTGAELKKRIAVDYCSWSNPPELTSVSSRDWFNSSEMRHLVDSDLFVNGDLSEDVEDFFEDTVTSIRPALPNWATI